MQDHRGNYWRAYVFVENARSYDVLENPKQAYMAAQAFGDFQCNLVDLPGPRLHDTKVNNILIDDLTGEGICVIDLDTVMPGLALYDFGDMVRAGTSAAEEDEVNLEKVGMRFEMYEALFRGFLSSAGGFLTPAERENLPFAGKLITLETAIRFLTDYLEGDVYFKTRRPHHNLDRCRNQLKIVESIESQMNEMKKLLKQA